MQQGLETALVVKGGLSPPASPSARGEAPGNSAIAVDDSSDAMLAIEAAADAENTAPALEQPSDPPTQEQRTATDIAETAAASAADAADVEGPTGSDVASESRLEQQQGGDGEWAAGAADEDIDDEATLEEDEV